MTVPERRTVESELEYLRRKEVCFGLWQAEALERIGELEAENQMLRKDKLQRVEALNATRNIINAVSDMILRENFDYPIETLAKDYSSFINVMTQHGVEPYAKRRKAT